MIERLYIYLALYALWLLRRLISDGGRLYALMSLAPLQTLLVRVGEMRARAVFLKASRECPAYQDFLRAENYKPRGAWSLAQVPVMTKENYIKRYTVEERCYGGAIPSAGVVINESSGSSGAPNNWVRSREEREDVRRILQLNYQLIYRDSGCILLNCFALGPWATGMNVSMSLVDVGILKSIGPDQKKLENTLELFGTRYRYLVFGYPPFIKSFVDTTHLDLSRYRLDLIVGGEGVSESLRAHLLKFFNSVISSYGASDLEINIGVETELTVNLRRRCAADPELSRALFRRDTPLMIFQYNPVDYIIERNAEGELLFTIGRQASAAPKIRYDLRDAGGVFSYKELAGTLALHRIDINELAPRRRSHFPFLYVHGRNDLTVPFYGAKIYPTDIEEMINADPTLARTINSFRLQSYEDAPVNRRLKIALETVRDLREEAPPNDALRELLFEGLRRVNQDFREVSKMFARDSVEVEVHAFETGLFSGRDARIKNKYVADT